MTCPRCDRVTLLEKDREGITVDICPECRGVWLDRGELDKLIQRAVLELEIAERPRLERERFETDRPARPDGDFYRDSRYRRYDDDDDDFDRGRRPYKKGWLQRLGDLID